LAREHSLSTKGLLLAAIFSNYVHEVLQCPLIASIRLYINLLRGIEDVSACNLSLVHQIVHLLQF